MSQRLEDNKPIIGSHGERFLSGFGIHTVGFNAGKDENGNSLTFKLGRILILIGPNNAGKTKALKEIHNWCIGNEERGLILNEQATNLDLSFDELSEILRSSFETTDTGEFLIHSGQPDGPFGSHRVKISDLEQSLSANNYREFRRRVLQHFQVFLDSASRLQLVRGMDAAGMHRPPINLMHKLQLDKRARERVRFHLKEVFKKSFMIDPIAVTELHPTLSAQTPDDSLEFSFSTQAVEFFSKSKRINESFGDGVKAYCGMSAAILGMHYSILMIDEPEAFMHPPLIRQFARMSAREAISRNGTLIVATHSADFLMGCLEEAVEQVSIVRLDYLNDEAQANYVPPARLKQLIRDPRIRSTALLKGLFHRCTIIVEAEGDRVFYDEVNRQLIDQSQGIADSHFTQAPSKNMVVSMVENLREFGLPAAGIVDVDYLFDDAAEHKRTYQKLGMATGAVDRLENLRKELRNQVNQEDKKKLKKCPRDVLNNEMYEVFNSYISELANWGIFVVPVGQLESWLSRCNLQDTSKRKWLDIALDSISPTSTQQLIYPEDGDVGTFINSIGKWAAKQH